MEQGFTATSLQREEAKIIVAMAKVYTGVHTHNTRWSQYAQVDLCNSTTV